MAECCHDSEIDTDVTISAKQDNEDNDVQIWMPNKDLCDYHQGRRTIAKSRRHATIDITP